MPADLALPTLPCRSIPATVDFYRRLGFSGGANAFDAAYAILTLGDIELHFFAHPALLPAENHAGCYIRTDRVEQLHAAFLVARLPAVGIPRLEAVSDKPWGMREFALVDHDGNLVRVGQVIRR